MARDLTTDARWMLLMLMAEGVEASGRALAAAWHRSSRAGRLGMQLRRLEASRVVQHNGGASVDARLFRLTATGRRRLLGDVEPEARWSRRWDGVWRLAMFDVPQTQARLRVRLRRKLSDLRFGWLQNSVWLSPDPIDQVLREVPGDRISADGLVFIEGRPTGGERDADLVNAAWDWSRLDKAYAAYRKILQLRPGSRRAARSSEGRRWLETELRAWREIEHLDPFLPEILWPQGYPGRAVWRLRLEALQAAGTTLAEVVAEEDA